MLDASCQLLLDAIPMGAILVAPDDRIAATNARAGSLLGENVVGRHYVSVLRQPDLLDLIERGLRDHRSGQCRYLARDGARDVTYVVSCGWVECAALRGALLCFEDISHLEHAGQMRRDFVANVSHELRTPLTALMGFIETLRGPARNDPQAQQRFLEIMAGEAARMERLVSDLLSLNRVETTERVRPTDPVDLGALITSVAHGLAPLGQGAGVALNIVLPADPVLVPGDADQLRQVLGNLIENAIKYGGGGGEVRLTLDHAARDPALRGAAAVIEVRDFGAGIEPQHIARLTERFYRVDGHRSREVGGTGLGLAIVKHIIGRHRGRLRIESAPGKGSSFTVVLPLAPE